MKIKHRIATRRTEQNNDDDDNNNDDDDVDGNKSNAVKDCLTLLGMDKTDTIDNQKNPDACSCLCDV